MHIIADKFNQKKKLLESTNVSLESGKKFLNTYVWSIALYIEGYRITDELAQQTESLRE